MGKFETREPARPEASLGSTKRAASSNSEQAAANGRIRRLRELYGKFVHRRPRGYRRFDSMDELRQAKDKLTTPDNAEQVRKPLSEVKSLDETAPVNTSSPEVPPGSPGETTITPTKKTPEGVSEKREQALATYRRALDACFDENGRFVRRFEPAGVGSHSQREVWNGREIAKHLSVGQEAEGILEVLSGERPMVFLDLKNFYTVSNHASPEALQKFFEEQGINLRLYAHQVHKGRWVDNLILYNPEAVKKIVEGNRDVFTDWDENASDDDNFKNGLKWEILREGLWEDQNPMQAYSGVRLSYKEDQVGTAKVLFHPVITPIQLALFRERPTETVTWSPEIARAQAMKTGLLMGFSKEVLEEAIEERMHGINLSSKLIERHNDLFKTSPGYKEFLSSLRGEEVSYDINEKILEASLRKPGLFGLSESDLAYLQDRLVRRSGGRPIVGALHSVNWDKKSEILEPVNAQIAESVRRSGIKDVQAEYIQRYKRAKTGRLGRALGKMVGRNS